MQGCSGLSHEANPQSGAGVSFLHALTFSVCLHETCPLEAEQRVCVCHVLCVLQDSCACRGEIAVSNSSLASRCLSPCERPALMAAWLQLGSGCGGVGLRGCRGWSLAVELLHDALCNMQLCVCV